MMYWNLCFYTSSQLIAPKMFWLCDDLLEFMFLYFISTYCTQDILKTFWICDNLLEFIFLHFISTYCTQAVSESFGYV